MPAQLIGLNFTNLQNVTPPSFSIGNTSTDILEEIPQKANEITGGFYGVIVLAALFVYTMWKLAQDEAYGGQGYDYVRAMGIAGAVCSIVGLFCVNIGFFVNFYHVVIFIIITFLCTVATWMGQ